MAEIVLAADTGRTTGSSASRRLRATGKVPAVVYGGKNQPTSVAVAWRDLRAALTTDKGLNALITLDVAGKRRQAVVKDLQRHPVRRDVLHVDFLEVNPDETMVTDVVIHIEGDADKVTREQGVIEQALSALVVEGKPAAIPGHISVDVSDLEVGHTITVADLDLPPGVTSDVDPDETVVTAQLTRAAMVDEDEQGEGADGAEAGAGDE